MRFDKFDVWGRVQTSNGFDVKKLEMYYDDEIMIMSGAHVGSMSMVGVPGTVEVYNGGRIDSITMFHEKGRMTIFSGGVVGETSAFEGSVVVKRGGVVSSAFIADCGGRLTVYSGGIVSSVSVEKRAHLDIRPGAIVCKLETIKYEKQESETK